MADQTVVTTKALGAFYDVWREIANAYPGGESIEAPGLLIAATGLDTAIFNKVFVFDDPEEGWLESAMRYFTERALPFSVELRPHLDDEPLWSAGFERFGDMPFMVWERPAREVRTIEGIVIEEIRAGDLEGFNEAVAKGFGMPRELVDAIGAHLADVRDIRLMAACDGDLVVGTSMGVGTEIVGIFTVATIPSYRGRGIGAATTAAAARGASLAYLQASSMGLPVYESMGFRLVERAGLYALPNATS